MSGLIAGAGAPPSAFEWTADQLDSGRRRIRLLTLLDTAERAGLAPLPILPLHALAYLSNVLAPVWDMPVLDGKILKLHGGPFYPSLQKDLDRLVGIGLVIVSDLGHVQSQEGRWRLEGAFRLNHDLATPVLVAISTFPDEVRLYSFIQELAFAFSALTDEQLALAAAEDAAYNDPLVSIGNVIDFAEWRAINYSARAADYFDNLLPGGDLPTASEKLHLYTRHLGRLLNASA